MVSCWWSGVRVCCCQRALSHHGSQDGDTYARTGGSGGLRGKSDPINAYAAARTVLWARVEPKTGDGIIEALRVLRVTRRGAVKARTHTVNQL